MRVKDAVGRFGEQVATDHLLADGLVILSRNWRCRAGELDIIARDGSTLVFVEVKTRSSLAFGTPAEAIDRNKISRIRKLAMLWIGEHRASEAARGVTVPWTAVRFDVVSVVRAPSGLAVDHVRSAF